MNKRHSVCKIFFLTILFLTALLLLPGFHDYAWGQTQSQTFATSGSFTVPTGVTSITVECWGGGGAGGGSTSNNSGGSGGGGGGYTNGTLTVTSGQIITYTVGTGGTGSTGDGNSGTATTFSTLTANGGTGGGSNKGTSGVGGSGSGGTTITKGDDGNKGNTSGGDGGAGANGGAGGTGTTNSDGNVGTAPGGGGGGGERGGGASHSGGAGGTGQITLTWITPGIWVSLSSLDFGSVSKGSTSANSTYTLSANSLSPTAGNITITAPSNFEVSTSSSTGFASSITVAYTSSALAATTIYVRFKPTAVNTGYSGNITNSGGGSTTQNIAVSGNSYYCSASGEICDEYISRVVIGSIDNLSNCSTGYTDNTSIVTDVTIGNNYSIAVTNGLGYTYDQCGIWVDWNQDGDFDDANETISVTGNPGGGPYTATITPPADASIGNTRMRIRIRYTGTVESCGSTTYGEVEDYSLNVVSAVTTYYSSGNNNAANVSYWWTNTNGTGSHPANFATSNQKFVIQNGNTYTTSAAWTLTGTNALIQVQSGGVLTESSAITLPSSGTLQIDNGGTFNHNINSVTVFSGTEIFGNSSTVNYGLSGNQSVVAGSYGNLNFGSSGTKTTLAGTISVAGNWSVSGSSAALNTNNTSVSVLGSITGTGTITSGSGTITISGDFLNSGTFTCGTGTVNYNGSDQKVKGATYYNLILSGGGTKSLQANGTIGSSGSLNLTSAIFQLGNFNFTISNNSATAITGTFGSTNMIATDGSGYLIKNGATSQTLYPVGGGGYYSPATLAITSGGTSGTISVKAVSTNSLGINFINKYWEVLTSATGKTMTASFQYDALEGNSATSVWYQSGTGAWQVPSPGVATYGTNSFTITGTTAITTTSTKWSAGAPRTYYSYKSGSWNEPTTWTSDPGGTTQVGSTIPSSNDYVEILSGRTVYLPADNLSAALNIIIDEGGALDLSTFQFTAGLKSLSGQGTLKIGSAVFPTPITTNTFVNAGGGTTEYYAGVNLPTQATYNNLTINADALTVTQMTDLTLNGNLLVKKGTFQINDATAQRLKLIVSGDVTVNAGASISVGSGVTNTTTSPLGITGGTAPFLNYYDTQSHRIIFKGNFNNNGTVRFTNLTYPVYNAFPPTTVGSTSGFATVYFQGASDSKLTCNGRTDFYNLVLDKGIDQTFKLTIYASGSSTSYFRLFGANNAGGDGGGTNPNLKKALWIRTGTLVLQGSVAIPSLSEGTNVTESPAASPTSEFIVPANGALVLDGADVMVQTTADSYDEINCTYAVSGGSGLVNGVTQGVGNSLILYGKLEVDNGFLSTKESSGILTGSTSPGQFVLNKGVVDTKQFISQSGSSASFEQNGGTLLLRGRFQRTPSAYTSANDLVSAPINTVRANDACLTSANGTFSLGNSTNIFSMSGGTMKIYDVCSSTSTLALEIKSSSANSNVTGGTVEFDPTLGTGGTSDATLHLLSTTTSLGNVIINRQSGTSTIQLSSSLTILGDLTLNSGVLNANNQDVAIGGNCLIENGTTFTPGTNTTTFNGLSDQTFTINLSAALGLNNFTIDKSAGAALTFGGSQKTVNVLGDFILVNATMNDNGDAINLSKNCYNSGIHRGTGSIIMNGTVDQTIDGNGIFQNLTLNNSGISTTVSLIANTTVNGALTFSKDKLFNIGTYNLRLTASASIVNGGTLRYVKTAGTAGDGGLTKVYSSVNSFIFPIGAPSTRHTGSSVYTPASIGFGVAPTTYGEVTVIPVGYEHPSTTTNGQSLTYFWRVKSSGFVGVTSVIHSFTYDQTDVVGTEGNYIPALYNRNTYSWVNGKNTNPPINTTTNTFTDWLTLGNSYGYLDADYTAGDNSFGVPKIFYSCINGASAGYGLWSSPSTWSFTSNTGTANTGTLVPGVNDIVVIGAKDSITLATNNTNANTDIRSCASLSIENGSALDIGYNPGCNFKMVLSHPNGNGNFRVTTSYTSGSTFAFPSGDFSDFNVNLGTTELYSTNPVAGTTYWLPNGVTTYGNLILSPLGGSNIIFANNDLYVYGNLVIRGQNADSWFCPTWNTDYPLTPTTRIAKTITVKGNLDIQGGGLIWYENGSLAQNFVVYGDVKVAALATLYVYSGATNQKMSIGGSLINNADGITHTGLTTISKCDFTNIPLTFFGANNASITNTIGSPSTIFSTVTVNKGSSQATTLTCNIGGTLSTPVNNWLTLQNGTFKYMRNVNSDFTISTTTPFTIPATAALHVEYTTANNILLANSESDVNDLYLNGKLKIVLGNVYVGPINGTTSSNNDIEYSGGGASEIEISGGNLVVNGQIRQNPSTASGILKYTQSAGVVTINGNKANTSNAKLEVLNSEGVFNMTGGTINILRGGGGSTYGDLYLRPGTGTVTDGDINFTNNISNSNQQYLLDANISLNNLTITGRTATTASNATVKLMVNPLVLNGNLTLTNAKSIFDANSVYNINVSIKGDFTNNGTYNHYNNLTTFNAGASNNLGVQSLLGSSATDFYDLVVKPVTKLSLSKDVTVNHDISLSDGTLDCSTYKVNVKGNVANNANYTNKGTSSGFELNGNALQYISGTGTFGLLNLNNSAGATTENDISLQSDLTMTSGILDINSHLITLGEYSNITLGGSTSFSESKMITSDGVWSNVGIRKVFGLISSPTVFTYPLGVPGKYTPAILTINSNGQVGSIRVNNISHYHPAVLDPNNMLNYYWEVNSVGISGFSGNFLLNYLQSDVVGGPESNYIAAELLTPGTNWSKAMTGSSTDNVDEANNTIFFNYSNVSDLTGEYTAGNDAAMPNIVPQYTSNKDGNWTEQTIWTPSGGTTYPCPVGGPNGFIVTINHEVTANANYCFSYKTYINNKLKAVTPYYGHNFGSVYGNGTLYVESSVFPAGRYDAFIDCSGDGTIEYGGVGTYDVNADFYSTAPNLTFSGTGSRVLPNKDLTVCHQLLINGPSLDNSNFNRKLTIKGTILRSLGDFISGSGTGATVSFAGSSAQTLTGFSGSNSFNNLEINNGSGLTFTGPIDVSNNLVLTNGLITTTSTNSLTITNYLTTCVYPDGGSTNSYVDGPLVKSLNQGDPLFKFPIGKKGFGLGNKLSISATKSGTLLWTAEYFNPNTYPTYASPLTAVNTKEYWQISGVPSNSQAYVELGWDQESDLTPLMTQNGVSDMRVAQHNGTNWIEVNSSSTSGSDVYNGSVESKSRVSMNSGTNIFTTAIINTPKPRIRLTPLAAVCGTDGIPVSLTSSITIVAPFTINYTENGVAKTITPASFPATIPTVATGAIYRLTGFTYNFPSGTIRDGVFDASPVTAYPVPTTAVVGPSISLCGASSATLTGNNPTIGIGLWTIISGTGGSVANPTLYNSTFTGTNGSGYVLRWTISSGGCYSYADLSINFPLMPVTPAAFTTSSSSVCLGETGVSYIVTEDPTATSYNWTYTGSEAVIHSTLHSGTIDFGSAATAGTLNVSVKNGCGTSAPRSMSISIKPDAIINLTSGAVTSNQSVCINSTIANINYTISGGGTGATVSGLPAGITGIYNSGVFTISGAPSVSGSFNFTVTTTGTCSQKTASGSIIVSPGGTWTGDVSTDWNTAGNWSCGVIPSITSDVQIPNVTNKPILSSGDMGTVKNITVSSGSSLTVDGNTLQIAGTISNSGTFIASAGTIEMRGSAAQTVAAGVFAGNTIKNLTINNSSGVTLGGALNVTGIVKVTSGTLNSGGNLTLISTAAQTALIDGSGSGNVYGKVTMQRYLPSGFGYKYFSSPFSDATVNEFAEDMNLTASFPTLYSYDENHEKDGADISGWTTYTTTTNALNVLEGYAVNFGSNAAVKTADITGVVNNGALTRSLYNNNGTYTKGFNLVGNPYPSPIDWNASTGWTKTNIDNAIYLFNAGTTDQYGGVYSSYVNGVNTDPSTNTTTTPNIIPSMQGFFVHVSDGTYPVSATLGVTNAVRVNNLNPVFKDAVFDNRTILRFAARLETKQSVEDGAVIYFDDQTGRNFEGDVDALKLLNTDLQVPNLYTISTDSKNLSINGMPAPGDSITTIPLGLTTFTDGWINFKANDITDLASDMNIYLKDASENITQNLKQNPLYRFYLKSGEYNNRFSLVFSLSDLTSMASVTPVADKMFTIIRSGYHLYAKVELPKNTKGDLMVTNMRGQVLLRKEVFEMENVEIDPNLSSGVYVVMMISGKRTQSEKILLRKDYE